MRSCWILSLRWTGKDPLTAFVGALQGCGLSAMGYSDEAPPTIVSRLHRYNAVHMVSDEFRLYMRGVRDDRLELHVRDRSNKPIPAAQIIFNEKRFAGDASGRVLLPVEVLAEARRKNAFVAIVR